MILSELSFEFSCNRREYLEMPNESLVRCRWINLRYYSRQEKESSGEAEEIAAMCSCEDALPWSRND